MDPLVKYKPNQVAFPDDLGSCTRLVFRLQNRITINVFELGSILNWVKTRDLVHGQFLNWLDKVNIDPRKAEKLMKVSTELSNSTTFTNLGLNALYEIATLPPEERNKVHKLNDGSSKRPDQMTVRELKSIHKHKRAKAKAKSDDMKEYKVKIVEFEAKNDELAKQNRDKEKRLGWARDELSDYYSSQDDHDKQKLEAKKYHTEVNVYKFLTDLDDLTNQLADLSEDNTNRFDLVDKNEVNLKLDKLQSAIERFRPVLGGRRTVNTVKE